MVLNQIERLRKDSQELGIYAKRLEKRGYIEKMQRILQKQEFLNKRIDAQIH